MSGFQMIDVAGKEVTLRRAIASGVITMSSEAFALISSNKLPKGDALALAQVAGVMAAKKTPDWIPLCHPIPVEKAGVRCELNPAAKSVTVTAEVVTSSKTGVEMEALTAVSAALLTIHDLIKFCDPSCVFNDIKLLYKEGGKSGVYQADGFKGGTQSDPKRKNNLEGLRVSVVTVSDRVSRGESTDKSGPKLTELSIAEGASIAGSIVVPDEKAKIKNAVLDLCETSDIVFTTGGTGFSERDVTPEAISELGGRMIPGFGEVLRSEGARHTALSYLSRSTAVLIDKAIVIALPGSTKACEEGFAALIGLLPHAVKIVRGGNHG